MHTYTFVCLTENQVATAVDIQTLDVEAFRLHALALLREHASAARIEIWRDDAVIDLIDREGVRPFPANPEVSGDGSFERFNLAQSETPQHDAPLNGV